RGGMGTAEGLRPRRRDTGRGAPADLRALLSCQNRRWRGRYGYRTAFHADHCEHAWRRCGGPSPGRRRLLLHSQHSHRGAVHMTEPNLDQHSSVSHSKTILCVEDEIDLRTDIAEELSAAGYDVVEAANGREALARLDTVHPDLILCDITMPELNGYEFMAKVRSEREDLAE